MDGLVSRASMIRLSLHPLPASETSAFNKIRAFSTRRAGLFPFRISVFKPFAFLAAQPHNILLSRMPTMVGPSKSRPPMSHRKTDLGIPRRSKSAKVVLGYVELKSRLVLAIAFARGNLPFCDILRYTSLQYCRELMG